VAKMIFLPFNVPSLKNSKIATTIGKGANKRTILLPSKPVKNYLQKLGIRSYGKKGVDEYATKENIFRQSVDDYFVDCPKPVIVKFHFVRDSKRRFDFHNVVQIVADLLVAHRFIEDDNMDYFLPVPMMLDGKWYTVDKLKPGVYVMIHGEE
jgi:hypothetical protein